MRRTLSFAVAMLAMATGVASVPAVITERSLSTDAAIDMAAVAPVGAIGVSGSPGEVCAKAGIERLSGGLGG